MERIPKLAVQQAQGRVAEIYTDIRTKMEIPFVPNFYQQIAGSETVLEGFWVAIQSFMIQGRLPVIIKKMIFLAIASARRCPYCSAVYQTMCRTYGVNEENLTALVHDPQKVQPERTRDIIQFALKSAQEPENLTDGDFEILKNHGLSNEEITEVVTVSGFAIFCDIIAQTFKIPVDDFFKSSEGSEEHAA